MSEINIPPFYVGQRVACLVNAYSVKKGDEFIVKAVFKHCCVWLIDIGILSPFSTEFTCRNCNSKLILVEGKPLCPEAIVFVPIEENFDQVTYEKVMEKESPLISVN